MEDKETLPGVATYPLSPSARRQLATSAGWLGEVCSQQSGFLLELVQQLPVIVWTTDKDLIITCSLGGGLAVLGMAPQQLVGTSLIDVLQTGDTEFLPVAAHLRALQGETSRYVMEWRGRPYEVLIEPLRGPDESIIGCLGYAADCTDRLQAASLQKEHATLAALHADLSATTAQGRELRAVLHDCVQALVRHLDVAAACIWAVNEAEAALQVEASAGLPVDRFSSLQRLPLAQSLTGRVALERQPRVTNQLLEDAYFRDRDLARREGLTAYAGYPLEVEGKLFGVLVFLSRHPLSATILDALALAARSVALAVHTVEDTTRRRKLEAQYRQAQKMEVVGQLAGGVAHDFNNLLTVITGYSELALNRLPEGDVTRGLIAEVFKAGERASSLTRQLLAFSRRQVLEPRVLDLNTIVTETEKMLHRLISEDICVSAALEPALGKVKADPDQLGQVLMNLAINARDAMPGGGKLTIETRNIELDEAYSHGHAGVTPGRYVMLAVSDTGCGMSEEVRAHLFEPFFTTKEQGKGTGLGLATVYGIVKQSGGHIEVYTEVGHGTTFKIYLPRTEQAAFQPVKSHLGLRPALRDAETILLVEDDPGVRALTRSALQTAGYTVLEAANGADALALVGRHPGSIHLLLADVIMPQMGGRELAQRLAASHPELRVLYLSGYTPDAVVRHGVLEPDAAFLQKPFTVKALTRKVREVLDR